MEAKSGFDTGPAVDYMKYEEQDDAPLDDICYLPLLSQSMRNNEEKVVLVDQCFFH